MLQFTVGDPEKDFFEQNPHWRYLKTSKELISKHGKELASKLRWAIFLLLDPDSKYFKYLMLKRVEIVNDYLMDTGYTIQFDPENNEILNEDLKYVIQKYPDEIMSKHKIDYYEREKSYQLLVQSERTMKNNKDRADVQLKLGKIYDSLEKSEEKYFKEKKEARKRARGSEQPGILFK